jgi:hypothetical protein
MPTALASEGTGSSRFEDFDGGHGEGLVERIASARDGSGVGTKHEFSVRATDRLNIIERGPCSNP